MERHSTGRRRWPMLYGLVGAVVLAACSSDERQGTTLEPREGLNASSSGGDCTLDQEWPGACQRVLEAIYEMAYTGDQRCTQLAGAAYNRYYAPPEEGGFRPMPSNWRQNNRMGVVVFLRDTWNLHPDYLGVTYLDWHEIERTKMDALPMLIGVIGHEEGHQWGAHPEDYRSWDQWDTATQCVYRPHNP